MEGQVEDLTVQLPWFSHGAYGNINENHSHVPSFMVYKGRNLGCVNYQLGIYVQIT